MAAADRRRAILDVVVPLLIEKGSAITTAEIAQAANIAEEAFRTVSEANLRIV